jgi:hypothetical protein
MPLLLRPPTHRTNTRQLEDMRKLVEKTMGTAEGGN